MTASTMKDHVMNMTNEILDMIELDAMIAPMPVLTHYIDLVGESAIGAEPDVHEHATTLLLKLVKLARSQSLGASPRQGAGPSRI